MSIKHPQDYREPSLPKFSAVAAALIAATMTASGAEQPVPLAGVPLPEPTQTQPEKIKTCVATTNAPTEGEQIRVPGKLAPPPTIKPPCIPTMGIMIAEPTPKEKNPKPNSPKTTVPLIEPSAKEPAASSRLDGDIIIEPSSLLPSEEKK